jgi:hypothetical protein
MSLRSSPPPNGYLLVGSDQRRGEFRRIHDSGYTVFYLPSAHVRAQEDVVCRVIITTEQERRMRTVAGLQLIAGSAPIQMQVSLPDRDHADEFVQKYMQRQLEGLDANDFLYQVNAWPSSRY